MSNNSNALAKLDTTALLLSDNFDDMKHKASMMIRSGLLPASIKTPEQFIVIAFHAVELDLPVMYAMRHITVINGNPTADAQAMSALVEKHFGDNAIIVTEQTTKQATVRVMKPNWKEPQFVTFTMEEAKAGKINQNWDKDKKEWVEKHTWRSHPVDMLRSRAVSRAARTYFPASIGGLYTPEEMGAVVDVNDDGTMTIIDVNNEPQTVPATAREVGPQATVNTDTGEITSPSPTTQRLPDKLVLRLEELATEADVDFETMTTDAVDRYQKRDYTWLSVDEAKDYAAWLKALVDEQAEAEQELIEA